MAQKDLSLNSAINEAEEAISKVKLDSGVIELNPQNALFAVYSMY